jgi:hypothetical protein
LRLCCGYFVLLLHPPKRFDGPAADIVGLDVVAMAEQHEILERAALLVRLVRVEARTARNGRLDVANLSDEDAGVVEHGMLADDAVVVVSAAIRREGKEAA